MARFVRRCSTIRTVGVASSLTFHLYNFPASDDTLTGYGSAINEKDKTLTLTKGSDKNWKANFTYVRPATDQLVLNGAMDGRQVQMKLKLLDRDKFTLVNRGFHWINEYPLQR